MKDIGFGFIISSELILCTSYSALNRPNVAFVIIDNEQKSIDKFKVYSNHGEEVNKIDVLYDIAIIKVSHLNNFVIFLHIVRNFCSEFPLYVIYIFCQLHALN